MSEILGAGAQVGELQTRVRRTTLPLDAETHGGEVNGVQELEGWQMDSGGLERKINLEVRNLLKKTNLVHH